MGDRTAISWTEATWNPVTGCDEVSPGCDRCYAKTLAERFRGTPGHYYENGFDVVLRPDKLDQPLRWARPRQVFVNSMSDLFHKQVPDEYIVAVFAVMALASAHTFQLLTKRHGRMRSFLSSPTFADDVRYRRSAMAHDRGQEVDRDAPAWPLPNVWVGVSVEDQLRADLRIPALRETPAAVRFLSCEPLLGPVQLCSCAGAASEPQRHPFLINDTCALHGDHHVDWVIAGGESGHGARPMHPAWARALRDQCETAQVAFHFKQWGQFTPVAAPHDRWFDKEPDLWVSTTGAVGSEAKAMSAGGDWSGVWSVGKRAAGCTLDGRTWDQQPTALAERLAVASGPVPTDSRRNRAGVTTLQGN